MSTAANSNITSVLKETRSFPPPPEFAARAHIAGAEAYAALRDAAAADPEAFWGARARADLHWFTPFDRVLEWKPPRAQRD